MGKLCIMLLSTRFHGIYTIKFEIKKKYQSQYFTVAQTLKAKQTYSSDIGREMGTA